MNSAFAKLNAKVIAQSDRAVQERPPQSPVFDKLTRKTEFARSDQGKALSMQDINRIVGLPVVLPMTPEEHEAYCRDTLLAEAFLSGFRYFNTQSDATLAFLLYRGLFGPIGVGWGKTLITLICCNICYTHFGVKKIVLHAPSSVMSQLLTHDLKWARTKIPINFPIHVLYDKPARMRRRISQSGQPGVYIFPYSLLSTKDSADNLDAIDPGAIICDEIQNLKDERSARTKRVMEFVRKRNPIGVGLSGTVTRKSIKDYYHLIRWCLGSNCPLPLSTSVANDWAGVLDANASAGYSDPTTTGPLQPLVQWAQRVDPMNPYPDDRTGFRRAYKLRLTTCPGVVASGDAEIGVGLLIQNQPVKDHESFEGWAETESLIEAIEEEWLTPNGDEIEYPIHKFKWMYELSAGFYNELSWPEPSDFARRKDIPLEQAKGIIDDAKVYHEAHQIYSKRLRQFLQYESEKNLDTPMMVGANMAAHQDRDVPRELYQLWREMKACDFDDRPERDRTAIRVCPYKVYDAVRWAQSLKGKGGIIWVYHQEMGIWISEVAREAGLDVMHCPAGNEANAAIGDERNKNKIVVASITAHGTGKNLQHFQNQYIAQWPRPAGVAEQLLGRTHRNGQEADELIVVTNNTLPFDDMNMAACINDSLYIHQTSNRQKLIIASYNPLPKIFPPEVLMERGFKPEALDREQITLLQEKFGELDYSQFAHQELPPF